MVHIVTNNAANYATAGKLLESEFHTLYWSPCAAHCLNLMLQDTDFIALQSILIQKDALRTMVTSKEWTLSGYARESKGKKFVDLVLDSMFSKECATIVQVTELLVRVLRLVDSDERPFMRTARSRNYDPIDFEEFGTNDTWVLEDEPPNLTEAEMETFRKELATCIIQGGQENDETLNLNELDTEEENENNDGDNVGGANEIFNVDDVQDHGGTEFGASWKPWR
ncbi:hypothetical protein ACH5RR_027073 [Cinchona calisaya]|uniref:DUF659 domain-containing protein n=1 Tax=Cinchona calisaya TaxID=153742 RepID=A0ABD2Z4F3_9GENT